MKRPRQMNVNMSAEKLAMVRQLAKAAGLTVSDVVRQLIRQAYARGWVHPDRR